MVANWLKLDSGYLDDDKIKLMRTYPEGDTLALMWVGLMCLAMRKESDRLYVASDVPYTPEDLANTFDIELKTVQMGLGLFSKWGMISIGQNGDVQLTNFHKWQNIAGLQAGREATQKRVAKHRAQKKIASNAVTPVTVTPTELELERELELELDKEKKTEYAPALHLTPTEHRKLTDRYGEKATRGLIEDASNWKKAKGKERAWKSDYHGLLKWAKKEGLDERRAPGVFVDPLAAERKAKAEGRLEDM